MSFLAALILLIGIVTGAFAEEGTKKSSVNFRDIHRDGKVAVIGHFGIPIGQIVTIEGNLAKPSKVSNNKTLKFTKVNGAVVNKQEIFQRWGQLIQIRNVDSLPMDETIIVEGYEFLIWRGDPEINWHLEVEFIITKIVTPKSLKLNGLKL